MTSASDALVVFGITGDLAYKQIFPALQAMIQRGHFDVPIVGVARSGNLDHLRARARDSLGKHGDVDKKAFAQLTARLQYIAGDYQDPERSSNCVRRWVTLRGRCTISPFHLRYLLPSPPDWRSPAARKTHGSSLKNPSATTSPRHRP